MSAEQRLARALERLGVLALLRRQLGLEQQRRHAEHAVHRRADLVAHVGQELALGHRGRFGLDARRLERQLELLPLGDVHRRAEDAPRLAVPVLGPPVRPVPAHRAVLQHPLAIVADVLAELERAAVRLHQLGAIVRLQHRVERRRATPTAARLPAAGSDAACLRTCAPRDRGCPPPTGRTGRCPPPRACARRCGAADRASRARGSRRSRCRRSAARPVAGATRPTRAARVARCQRRLPSGRTTRNSSSPRPSAFSCVDHRVHPRQVVGMNQPVHLGPRQRADRRGRGRAAPPTLPRTRCGPCQVEVGHAETGHLLGLLHARGVDPQLVEHAALVVDVDARPDHPHDLAVRPSRDGPGCGPSAPSRPATPGGTRSGTARPLARDRARRGSARDRRDAPSRRSPPPACVICAAGRPRSAAAPAE